MALFQYSSLQEARALPVQSCPGRWDFLALLWFCFIFRSWPYLRFSHTSKIPTSAGGLHPELALLFGLLKTAPTPEIFADEEMRQMQVTRLLVGNVFNIVILF